MSEPRIEPFNWRRHNRVVLGFQREIYEVNFPGFAMNPSFERRYSDDLRRALGHPSEGVYVLEDSRGTCGFLWVSLITTMVEPCIGYIKNIYVLPERRGEGLGKRLLAFAEEWCAQRGAEQISLDASCCNERAVGLYRQNGYEVTRVRMEKPVLPARRARDDSDMVTG